MIILLEVFMILKITFIVRNWVDLWTYGLFQEISILGHSFGVDIHFLLSTSVAFVFFIFK